MEVQSFPPLMALLAIHGLGQGPSGESSQASPLGGQLEVKCQAAGAQHRQTVWYRGCLLSSMEIIFAHDTSFSGCADAGPGKLIKSGILCPAALLGTLKHEAAPSSAW